MKPTIPTQLTERYIDSLSVEELIELQKTKMHTAQMIWRVVRSKGEESIKHYAKLMNYNYGWIKRQTEQIENSQFNNYKIKQVLI